MAQSGVRFARVHGRIVPIKAKAGGSGQAQPKKKTGIGKVSLTSQKARMVGNGAAFGLATGAAGIALGAMLKKHGGFTWMKAATAAVSASMATRFAVYAGDNAKRMQREKAIPRTSA